MARLSLPDEGSPPRAFGRSLGVWLCVLSLAACAGVLLACAGCRGPVLTRQERLRATWAGYKKAFIVDGRVVRPRNGSDTVSEGQAYAMLRAAWMGDKQTFDQCYAWTETHLSRRERFGDNLLAWRYGKAPGGGPRVLDWNAASDADLDYALALLLAAGLWKENPPTGLTAYREKALAVAADVMRKEVRELPGGRLVLVPWPVTDAEGTDGRTLVNPSYFSPAHYRAFYEETGDARWKKLLDDTYDELARILQRLGDVQGVGLAPDWCLVDDEGRAIPSTKHGTVSSWDAFRLWWRLALDWSWAREQRAKALLEGRLLPFLRREMAERGRVCVEYDYAGKAVKAYSSPAVLGTYAWALREIDASVCEELQRKLQGYFRSRKGRGFYGDASDYYVSSWAWFGDAVGEDFVSPPGLHLKGEEDL